MKPLSPQQITILRLMIADLYRWQIADTLHVHPQTVATQVARIKEKLGVKTLYGMVAEAIRIGAVKNN